MKRILVPTDFSQNAMNAVLYAAKVAGKANATLYLLHVIEPIDQKVHQPFPLHEKYIKETITLGKNSLRDIQNSLLISYPDVKVETELLSGTVVSSIIDFAERNNIDLIIMGTKGATGLKEIFIGSVTASLISHVKLPVLAVPDKYFEPEPDGILLATNHFEENKEILKIVSELARLFSATIHVVVFIEERKADVIAYMDYTRQLDRYIKYLEKTFPDISFKGELLEGRDFEEAVKEYDDNNKLDIISMITYPKGFWTKMFKGSATKNITFHSRIPVLAIPADQGDEESGSPFNKLTFNS